MKVRRKRIMFTLSALITVAAVFILFRWIDMNDDFIFPSWPDNRQYNSLEERAVAAMEFARRHHLNEDYCFFIDYAVPSGTPRLFVWSFEKNRIVRKIHVMHGPGRGSTAEIPVFSNAIGSECSSLGRFVITKQHGNKIKRSYKLMGLDWNNLTAYPRGLMIHSSRWVDRHCREKCIPLHPESCRGCVTVSTSGLQYLEKIIEKQSTPILLWSYQSELE